MAASGPCYIGLDLGTTRTRAVLFDRGGVAVADASQDYPLETPHPAWAEQDPELVYQAALDCLRTVVRDSTISQTDIAGVGLSGTLHNIIAIGDSGEPLTPAVIWADTRATREVAEIRRLADAKSLYARTGCPVHPMYPVAKLRWLRQEQPRVFAAARRFASIKDFVFHRLAGSRAVDFSGASGTGMLALRTKTWDDEALGLAGVTADQLGDLVEPTFTRPLTRRMATETGLLAGTPIAIGAGDGVLSALGTGTLASGQMTAMIGTSGAVRVVTNEPRVDRDGRTWCYYLAKDRWVAGAAIHNAGMAYDWTAEKLLRISADDDQDHARLSSWADDVPPGSGGLIFLPFLAGERSPYWNANARGVMFGLSINHDYRHVIRATLEGVCYRMRSCYQALDEVAGPIREIRAAGGFVHSPLWLQMLSDVFGRPLLVPNAAESSALGAAVVAMLADGTIESLEEVSQMVSIEQRVHPAPERHDTYNRLYDLYSRVYWKLQEEFDEITAFQREGK
ncbi:MAG TPA: gluconokinase [Chloroflexota bacterium]|nr:gluconokinase [Chloroflexota bacterium]